MKRILIITAIITSTVFTKRAQAQEDTSGIRFEQILKWSEIVGKAKAEHKYIFVDCYATWCGPCKVMDANIYPQKEVAAIYNKEFISVKIQMDRSSNDDSLTKSRYERTKTFEQNYNVDSYPTFLFFDTDGRPVHKVSGSFDVKGFIQLAADAQNPQKQNYNILKNFQPGKVDTAEEKGLAITFAFSDREVAAKIAADYLTRIPRSQLKLRYNGGLIQLFQDDPHVFALALKYLYSLDKAEFADQNNINIIQALIEKPQMKTFAIAHIQSLSGKDIGNKGNLQLMIMVYNNAEVRKIAKKYIDQLPEKIVFSQTLVDFLQVFTSTAYDRGFNLFYKNTAAIDKIVNDSNFAQSIIRRCIYNSEYIIAHQTGNIPDFENLKVIIIEKYKAKFVLSVNAKEEWYGYLVHDHNKIQYWPQLIRAEVELLQPFPRDSAVLQVINYAGKVNNICWDTYLHDNDQDVLLLEIEWMKTIAKVNLNKPGWDCDLMDTYACLLYKLGSTLEARRIETSAIEMGRPFRSQDFLENLTEKTLAMQRGEKIWTEKEFQ